MNKRTFLTALCFCCALGAVAQELNSVTFEQPKDSRFAEDVFRMNVQSRKGAPYDERIVNEDIKRLHATGYFSDIVAETIKNRNGKIDLVFKVIPMAMIREVKFTGNKKYEKDKLLELVTVAPGSMMNNKRLQDSANALRKFYMDKGHNDAKISPVVTTDKNGDIIIDFKIQENLKQKVDKVIFTGATVFKPSELKSSISNHYSILNWLPFLDFGLLDKSELPNDVVRLRELYWTKGYLDFVVKETRLHVDEKDPEYVTIEFIIDEGKPYKIGKVSLSGNTRFKTEDLQQILHLKEGDTFSSLAENATTQAIEDRYSPLGYADLYCRVNRLPDYLNHKVDLVVDIHEGRPYKVRDVFISGNKWTKDHVIRRELAIAPDDPVDKHLISASRDRLMGMGYFKKVEAVSISSPDPNKKDIDIKVEGAEAHVIKKVDTKELEPKHGLYRALLHNMVVGVTQGYTKSLKVNGVGWKVAKQGNKLVLNVGFSHPVEFAEPAGVTLACPSANEITVTGIDKTLVGQTAANIRGIRVPEPYHGYGIAYSDEVIERKEGKTGGKGKK